MSVPGGGRILVLALGMLSSTVDEPIPVRLRMAPGRYFAGQSIPLQLDVGATRNRPTASPPQLSGGDLTLLQTGTTPLGTTFTYRLVPRRAGRMVVGPFQVRDDTHAGSSRPLTIAVENPPLLGRPAEFLGGVGSFAVEAVADPPAVRRGQPFSYTIRVTGPAAPGMIHAPDLARFDRLPIAPRVTFRGTETAPEPPSRTFRYEVRPTRAGAIALPPVSIAAFDPKLGRYLTRVTSGVPVRVVEVPAFDPRSITLDSTDDNEVNRRSRALFGTIVGILLVLALLTSAAVRGLRHGRDVGAARRVLARAVRKLGGSQESPGLDREITAALADYLTRAIGRPPGALTPDEARRGVERATGDYELGAAAQQLIARCDRSWFGPGPGATSPLKDEAIALFTRLRRRRWQCGKHEARRGDQERQ